MSVAHSPSSRPDSPLPSCTLASTAGLRVELARPDSLRGRDSLASASVETPSATHADLCPPSAGRAARVKIGGVLRGVLPRSSLRVGARAEMRYAAARREPNPASDPHSGYRLRLRAPFKSAENGEFPSVLFRPRLPRPFSGQNRSLWGSKCPPRLNFAQKTASEVAARPPATRPECPARRKTRGHLLFGVLLPGADSGPHPAPSRPRKRVRDWGRAYRHSAAMISQSLDYFFNPPSKSTLHTQRPRRT